MTHFDEEQVHRRAMRFVIGDRRWTEAQLGGEPRITDSGELRVTDEGEPRIIDGS